MGIEPTRGWLGRTPLQGGILDLSDSPSRKGDFVLDFGNACEYSSACSSFTSCWLQGVLARHCKWRAFLFPDCYVLFHYLIPDTTNRLPSR